MAKVIDDKWLDHLQTMDSQLPLDSEHCWRGNPFEGLSDKVRRMAVLQSPVANGPGEAKSAPLVIKTGLR